MTESPIAWSPHYPMNSYQSVAGIEASDEGVYVIWYLLKKGGIGVLDVGSGVIQERIAYHLRQHPDWVSGDVAFTWSPVPYPPDTLGIEAYLADLFRLRHTGQRRYPDVERVAVASPLAA